MNSKHAKILKDIFSNPIKANIKWDDVEKMMLSIGAEIKEGSGSRGTFIFKNRGSSFHRPHPPKEAKEYQIRILRKFLAEQGVEYEG